MKRWYFKIGFILILGFIIFFAQNIGDGFKVWASSSTAGFSFLENRVPHISAGDYHTLGLKADGTVLGIGYNGYSQTNVSGWNGIKGLAAGSSFSLGLKTDGTVVGLGDNSYGQRNVSGWTGIKAIAAGGSHAIGLKTDGTVVGVGNNLSRQVDVSSWTNIVAIAAGSEHTVGLRSDGTVVATGYNNKGQINVLAWSNIVAVAASGSHTLGLKADGTLVAAGDNTYGQLNVSSWTNIVAIDASYFNTVGLKADGTAVSAGDNSYLQNNVSSWTNIIGITGGSYYTVGLKSDGTAISVGRNDYGQRTVTAWTLKIYNRPPILSLASPTADMGVSTVSGYNTFTLSGKIYDQDNQSITISAAVGGVSKSITVSPAPTSLPVSNNWTMSWSGSELSEGQYSNIVITADDTERTHSASYSHVLTVDKSRPSNPTLNLSSTDWTCNDLTFSIIHGSDSETGVMKSQYRLNSGTWADYSTVVTISTQGITVIEVKTIDKVGNTSSIVTGTAKIDKTAPTAPTISLSAADWTTGSVNINIGGGTDALSGVARTEYRLGAGGTWNTYSAAFKIYDPGITPVYARTVDLAGNTAESSTLARILINTAGPLVNLLVNNGAAYIPSVTTNLQITAIDSMTLTADLTIRFSNDNINWTAWETFVSLKTWSVQTGDGLKTVYTQVKDMDGNITTAKANTYLSTSTPSNSGLSPLTGSLVSGSYYIRDNEVTVSMINSGAATVRFSVTEGAWSDWEAAAASKTLLLPSGDGKKRIQLQLKNSNEKPSIVYMISFVLDTAAPEFDLTTLNGATATSSGSINLEVSNLNDKFSANGFTYSIDGGVQNFLPENKQIAVTGLTTGLRTIRIRIYDQAGNYSEKSLKIWCL